MAEIPESLLHMRMESDKLNVMINSGRSHLGTDIFKGSWADERKTNQEHVLKRIRKNDNINNKITCSIGSHTIRKI